MTNEELALRAARLKEAFRRGEKDHSEMSHLADLYETCWTPPEPVDPDLLAAREWAVNKWPANAVYYRGGHWDTTASMVAFLAGIKHARALDTVKEKT
jgi:hypothetical protein